MTDRQAGIATVAAGKGYFRAGGAAAAALVDLVGVDGFNWGATQFWSARQSPAEVFTKMLDRLERISTAPVCVPEFGCTSLTADGADPERKSRWLREAFALFRDRDVAVAAYFDVEKETDWQVFGGSRGANSFAVDGTSYQTYPGFRSGYRRFLGL